MFNKLVFMIKTKFLLMVQVYSTSLKNTNVINIEYIYISHAIGKLIYNWQFEEKIRSKKINNNDHKKFKVIKTIAYEKDCKRYIKWPSIQVAMPYPQLYPGEEIVVFLGLKVFNSDNNSPYIPAKEMRSSLWREPRIENNRFPKL